MSHWKFAEIVEALKNADFEPHAYTGRGMGSRECLSVHSARGSNVVLDVVKKYIDEALESNRRAPYVLEHASLLIERLRNWSSDRLGHDFVIYWSDIEWESEQAVSVEADDDGEYEQTEKVNVSSLRRTTLPSAVDLRESTKPKGKKR